MFKPYSIRNFPVSLKKKLEHLSIDSPQKKLARYIIHILENHVKEKTELKIYGEGGHYPYILAKD